MTITFDNVSITIEADTPRDAYRILSERCAFGTPQIHFRTDTYFAYDQKTNAEEEGDTKTLMTR
jgi:hypothetical protein